MQRTPVTSSNIAAIGYENGTLEVEYKSGPIWQYSGVPEPTYRALMAAKSKGTYNAKNIKGKFPGKQIR